MSVLHACSPAHQKRMSVLTTDGCESPCDFWELNSGPVKEQSVLLISEPSLQPKVFLYNEMFVIFSVEPQREVSLWKSLCLSIMFVMSDFKKSVVCAGSTGIEFR